MYEDDACAVGKKIIQNKRAWQASSSTPGKFVLFSINHYDDQVSAHSVVCGTV